MSAHLKHDDYIPLLREVGAEWLVVSDGPIAAFAILVTPSAGPSVEIEFPKELANADYVVVAQAEGLTDVYVDESTKTTTGCTVLGTFTGAEVANILVIGSRLKTQPEPIVR